MAVIRTKPGEQQTPERKPSVNELFARFQSEPNNAAAIFEEARKFGLESQLQFQINPTGKGFIPGNEFQNQINQRGLNQQLGIQDTDLQTQANPQDLSQQPQQVAQGRQPGEPAAGFASPVTTGDLVDLAGLMTAVGGVKTFGGRLLSKEAQTKILGSSIRTMTARDITKGVTKAISNYKGVLGSIVGVVTAGAFLGFNPLRGKVSEYQQASNTLGETTSDTLQALKDGRLQGQDAIRELDRIEEEMSSFERQLLENSIPNFRARNSGEMIDILTDLKEKKLQVIDARNEARQIILTQQFPEANEETINTWVSQLNAEERRRVSEEYRKQINSMENIFNE